MGKVIFQQSVSLDGFSAGPDQSLENPLGIGGEDLHTWAVEASAWREQHGLEGGADSPSNAVLEEVTANIGANIMGRNMFGGGPGPWDGNSWRGWWGEDPPFHTPVFVLTHHPREPMVMEGGTEFHFVTEGPDAALAQARAAAGDRNISIGGGADTIQQYLRSGAVDEFWLQLVPLVLGGGTRFLENIPSDIKVELLAIVEGRGVTHLKYRVIK